MTALKEDAPDFDALRAERDDAFAKAWAMIKAVEANEALRRAA